MQKQPLIVNYVYSLLAIVLTVYGIIVAKNFLYPITFGILLAYLLYPVANYLEKKNFPRILSIFLSLILSLTVVFFALFFIYKQLSVLLDDFPGLRRKAINNIEHLVSSIETTFGIADEKFEFFLKDIVNTIFESGRHSLNLILSATTGTLFKIGILPVYVFLFLYYRTKFAYFILKVVNREKRDVTVKILKDISTIASRYMLGVATVVLILSVINSVGLMVIGIEYALILGIVSAICNFIPYFGTLIGGAIPFVFALLTGDSPLLALRVFILFVIIQFLENNILTPNIVGDNVKISPLFIIFSLIVAAMIWGIPGMLVVIPFLAMFKIVIVNIERFEPYAYLLDNRGTQRHAITVEKIRDFFLFRKSKKTK